MSKWICKACGYTHIGDEPPEYCPQCGSPQSQFYLKGHLSGCSYGFLFILLVVAGVIYSIFACRSSSTVDNTVVKTVDINRYLGRWYEIARLDHKFERGMTHCTATYRLKDNGTIKVTNEGMKRGKQKVSTGKAKLTNKPGVLRVSFWGPFYSDYRILMLNPDYSYVLVGGGSDDYLWILSRTPQLSDDILNKLITEAQRRGYNTEKLIWVEQ